jgi:hypothetical protein
MFWVSLSGCFAAAVQFVVRLAMPGLVERMCLSHLAYSTPVVSLVAFLSDLPGVAPSAPTRPMLSCNDGLSSNGSDFASRIFVVEGVGRSG